VIDLIVVARRRSTLALMRFRSAITRVNDEKNISTIE
jgi:hypothetical protein